MKKVVFILIVIISFLGSNYANAQHYGYGNQSKNNTYYQRSQNASIIFRNNSNYSMLLKIVGLYGGYTNLYLYLLILVKLYISALQQLISLR